MKHATLWLAPLALATLVACGQKDESTTVGQKIDEAVVNTERKADEAKAAVGEATAEAKAGAQAMGDKVAEKVSDATITAAVNAEIAKDNKLSALKIDVDTRDGYVQLKGSAPDSASVDRATMLAASVKGVLKVDNQLSVSGG
jgi:hyperosmotically inducible periplasmic protein